MSSSLCSVARLIVEPARRTGSSSATGVRTPVRPTWTVMLADRRFRLLRLVLVGHGPARALGGGAQYVVQVSFLDLDDGPVDLEREVMPQALQFVECGEDPRPYRHTARNAAAVRNPHCTQCLQQARVACRTDALQLAGRVQHGIQRPVGHDTGIELLDASRPRHCLGLVNGSWPSASCVPRSDGIPSLVM